ncbi:hypothetical protein GCM10010082_17790 [Kushneria pakistanensis]|uniref:Uncharacterized protein n=1 Tax=Kushneria pakistanensis TaxID=1508770 RepID=A0ABQ3FI41_9GAMM|nr:hypothetical protein [Kushneria pakistanensis]GHC25369.1 hypothetical protein GCM10010082_17790 [Kushneria pakistanensis]
MAKRPVFVSGQKIGGSVKRYFFDFEWSPGFSETQKRKNINKLHEAAYLNGFRNLLEISTKSESSLGVALSAFNLQVETEEGFITVESIFQGSKVFEKGGPYTDLYFKTSKEAKRDERIKSSGRLTGFNFLGDEWPLEPKTAFYDWVYIHALESNPKYAKKIMNYDGFTDIEFNPEKAINCQAATCALYVNLMRSGKLKDIMSDKERFIKFVYGKSGLSSEISRSKQISFI